MDLTSSYSAYMVFRVARILNLPNLSTLIYRAEVELLGGMDNQRDLGGSYLSGGAINMSYTLPLQMLELEGPNFQYNPFFGEGMKHQMMKVVAQLSDALESVQAQQSREATSGESEKSCGFFASLFSSGGGRSYFSSPEFKRLPAHLEHAIHNFCNIFSISRPSCVSVPSTEHTFNTSVPNTSTYLADSENEYPECVETESGLKLTDLGRRQLINKQRKFDRFFVGDPDLLPVRSYENTMLVRMLFHFCSFINSYLNAEFNSLYHRQDFIGHFARIFLIDPFYSDQQIRKMRSPVMEQAAQRIRSRQPRISLRFLASYHTMTHMAIVYVVLSLLFGFGVLGVVFVLLSMVLIYGLVLASYRTVMRHPAPLQ